MIRGTAESAVVPAPLAGIRQRRLNTGDRVFRGLAYGSAIVVFLIAFIFLIALIIPALPSISRSGFSFIVNRVWDPVHLQFGALPAIYGTAVTAAI